MVGQPAEDLDDQGFHIIDTVEINDSRASDGQGGLFPSRIVWDEVVFDSFQSGFLRNIDFELCMRLQHPTALRMYRFLGKRFHLKPDWTFDLKEFAYEHIGLGRNYEGGTQIARKLRPAILELEEVGFLEPLSDEERFPREGREWMIRFLHRAPALSLPLGTPLALASETPSPLVTELVNRGVTKTTAVELIEAHGAESIQSKLDVFDWMVSKKDKRIGKNPAGYLCDSIRKDYSTPKGFVSRAEREAKEEAGRKAEQTKAEANVAKREQEARDAKERKAVEAYLKQLSPTERKALETEALAAADEQARQNYHNPTLAQFRDTLMLSMLRDHVRQKLREQESMPADQ